MGPYHHQTPCKHVKHVLELSGRLTRVGDEPLWLGTPGGGGHGYTLVSPNHHVIAKGWEQVQGCTIHGSIVSRSGNAPHPLGLGGWRDGINECVEEQLDGGGTIGWMDEYTNSGFEAWEIETPDFADVISPILLCSNLSHRAPPPDPPPPRPPTTVQGGYLPLPHHFFTSLFH